MTLKNNKSSFGRIIHGLIAGLLAVILFFQFAKYITEPNDRDRCHGMLNEGKWVTDEYKEWQPSSCMMQRYSKKEFSTCLGNTRIVYIGDSIIREQYYSLAEFLGYPKPKKTNQHNDQTAFVKKPNITIEMWWDPYINSTKTLDLLNGKDKGSKPSLLVMDSGVWYIRRTGPNYLSLWKTAVDRVFDSVSKRSIADKVMFSPVEIVEYATLDPIRQETLLPERMVVMNNYLRQKELDLKNPITPLVVPFVWNEIVTTSKNQTVDGLHFKTPVTSAQAQLALNYRCNDDPSIKNLAYPYDTTCCYTYPKPTWYQSSIFFAILFCVPLGIFLSYLPSDGGMLRSLLPSKIETLTGLFVFGLGLIYMYLGDRSQLFGKLSKHFDPSTFTILCLIVLAIGAVTLKSEDSSKDLGFLNRDQTDEWKGWMQLVILIYHFTGASKIAGIYNPMRVLVAAYLFQTGYGHFFFFYKKADFGVSRVLNVLVRLNLLTCVLCYLMKTDYLFYYFSPLVTFWFIVIWVTMRIMYKHNQQIWFILAKIGIMSILTSFIIHFPGVLEGIFGLLAFLFKVQWNVVDWRFRMALDAWIVYIGMLCALLTIKINEHKVYNNARLWFIGKWAAVGLSIVGMIWFLQFEVTQTKGGYTSNYHPYISWVPILSFVILRNFSHLSRNVHSRFFAFIGKISLETYIGQFHMWLAADTRGLLVVLPNTSWVKTSLGWYVNLLVSSVIFFFVCYHISQTTGVITKWLCSGASEQQEKESVISKDTVPLLPTTSRGQGGSTSNLLAEKNEPAKLQVDSDDDEALDIDDAWGESIYNHDSEKPAWYRSVLDNYWIRSFVYLVLFGILNRFCA